MNSEKLQKIRQVEKAAQELISSTEDKTHGMIRDAHNKVLELMVSAKKTAREQELRVLADYQKKGEMQAETILSELDRELKAIDNSTDKGEMFAIDYLKEQMKVVYGNS